MSSRTCAIVVPLAAGLGAASVTLTLGWYPGRVGLGAVGFLLCWLAFSLWPWAVVPAGIIGGTIAAVWAGYTDVKTIALAHLMPLAAGAAALATRRLFGDDRDRPTPPAYRLSVSILAAATLIGVAHGLAAGHTTRDIITGTYQVGVIPVYFVITIFTLDTPDRRRRAAVFYAGLTVALAIIQLTTPGRHGGLLSVMAIPLLVVLVGDARGWRRAGLAVLILVLAGDVVLASYRSVWVAGGGAVIVMALFGGRDVRRGIAVTAASAVALFVVLSLGQDFSQGIGDRLIGVDAALARSAGYRGIETSIGWHVFSGQPLFGAGLGQTTRHVYIAGFAITDVGPMYHSLYIVVLANLGLVGLLAVFWPIAGTVWTAVRRREGAPLAFAALTCGFLVAATVSGPSDGHWELGLLPALTMLTLHPHVVTRSRWLGDPVPRRVPVGTPR